MKLSDRVTLCTSGLEQCSNHEYWLEFWASPGSLLIQPVAWQSTDQGISPAQNPSESSLQEHKQPTIRNIAWVEVNMAYFTWR